MKVLLTAFKPFNKQEINYSWEVLKYINDVDFVILDVCYDECYNELKSQKKLDSYDIIIAMGEARMRNELMVEVVAKNISSCSLPDNSGIVKKDELINLDGKDLQTFVKLDKIQEIVKLSYDAGKFVCNNLYYRLLSNYPSKSIFIHIPECYNNDDEYIKYANVIMNIIDIMKKGLEDEISSL